MKLMFDTTTLLAGDEVAYLPESFLRSTILLNIVIIVYMIKIVKISTIHFKKIKR